MSKGLSLAVLLALAASGCGAENGRRPQPDAAAAADSAPPNRTLALAVPSAEPVVYVDSARPIEEELRRFREGLEEPTGLAGGMRTRDALVGAFVRAVERQDTATLKRLRITPAEFAHLYYPYTIYTHPPYQQAPGLVWMQVGQNSQKGLKRVLRRQGGESLDYHGYRCERTELQDLNVLHHGCELLLGGHRSPVRLFGTIIERAGRFKFISYANRM